MNKLKQFLSVLLTIIVPLLNVMVLCWVIYTQFVYYPKHALTENYEVDAMWKETCWVKSLEKLNELKNDKDILDAKCIGGNVGGNGHMWISYRKEGKHYLYDPSNERLRIKIK